MDVDECAQKSHDFPDSPDIEKISRMLTEHLDVEKHFPERSSANVNNLIAAVPTSF